MISDLCNNADRTQDIADMAIKVLKDPQRCVLVLSERRKHLEDIYKLLETDARWVSMWEYEGVREKTSKRNARVIMASVSAAAEGFDVPRLNCIILASPRRRGAERGRT
jgi:superfamily II DNA or RNA helicase